LLSPDASQEGVVLQSETAKLQTIHGIVTITTVAEKISSHHFQAEGPQTKIMLEMGDRKVTLTVDYYNLWDMERNIPVHKSDYQPENQRDAVFESLSFTFVSKQGKGWIRFDMFDASGNFMPDAEQFEKWLHSKC
jgi:hypothetical protein